MYKRITSYIYSYENGERLSNCGYFRFDIRENQCKLSINVKVPDKYTMGIAEVYLAKKDEKGLIGIMLGKTGGLNGNICYKHMGEVDDIAEDVGIDQIAGIVIYDGINIKKAFAGSVGDDKLELLSFHKDFTEENTVYEIDAQCQEKWCEEMAEQEEEVEEEQGSIASMDIKSQPVPWQELLFSKFPKVRVDFGGYNTEAIKMRPHDLVWFPRKYWRYSNNQWLLNGYYNHRYIMLVRGEGQEGVDYYLAVPGGNGINDASAARKQGFGRFIKGNSDAGYWCCKVGQ